MNKKVRMVWIRRYGWYGYEGMDGMDKKVLKVLIKRYEWYG